MDVRRATLANMGLRNEASVAFHILQENVWESNLVSDIAKVNYLAGNEGQTNLHPLECLPPFVDDAYVCGPIAVEDVVVVHGRPSCTTGENETAKRLVAKLAGLAWEVWRQKLHVSIVHTVAKASSGKISETIEQIGKSRLGQLAVAQWHRIQPESTIAAYFVAKCDVSELPMQELQKGLPGFCRRLLSNGFGLYQIDYTRDFAGTLDRPALVAHLVEQGFRQQGDQPTQNDSGCILDNTTSVGNHVCTFVQTKNDRTIATTFYNKIVSQIEAGDVRKGFEGHAAHLLESTNQHLRRTLAHPEDLAKGCTRLEVSVYGCGNEDLSETAAEEFLGEALALSIPCQVAACAAEGHQKCAAAGLFVVQSLSRQWQNYASQLDHCLVLGDRPRSTIYVAWSGHSGTGRVQGIQVQPTKTTQENDAAWAKAMRWAMADFGLRRCPIFEVEILGVEEDEILFSSLRCFHKDAPTTLVAWNKPCELHPNAPDAGQLLPPTEHLECVWRRRKVCNRIGVERPSCELVELPALPRPRHCRIWLQEPGPSAR